MITRQLLNVVNIKKEDKNNKEIDKTSNTERMIIIVVFFLDFCCFFSSFSIASWIFRSAAVFSNSLKTSSTFFSSINSFESGILSNNDVEVFGLTILSFIVLSSVPFSNSKSISGNGAFLLSIFIFFNSFSNVSSLFAIKPFYMENKKKRNHFTRFSDFEGKCAII
mgnify:CR=1 FL=1